MKKSIVNDIGLYKTRLLSMLTEDSDICGLLLNKEDFTEAEANGLPYSQIFPYLYINTQAETKTCLCFEVDVPQIPTGMIKDMRITAWAYSPFDQMPYEKDGFLGTRPDILADMIERAMGKQRNLRRTAAPGIRNQQRAGQPLLRQTDGLHRT